MTFAHQLCKLEMTCIADALFIELIFRITIGLENAVSIYITQQRYADAGAGEYRIISSPQFSIINLLLMSENDDAGTGISGSYA